jgi:enoyl-CoA hydratase/carnithine racemase
MYKDILYEVDDPIATITLNRPDKLNAWTHRMGEEVRHAVARAERDPAVVGMILTGTGRGFCAGADLKQLSDVSEGSYEGANDPGLEAQPGDPEAGAFFLARYAYLLAVRKPVVAAINGPCAGMAVPISLCADLRFASDRAVFTTAFSRRGLIAEWGSSWLLPRLVGPAHAADLLYSARKVDAREAERMGLVNKVVEHDALLDHSRAWIREVAECCSPASVSVMKRQLWKDASAEFGPSHDEAVRLMVESFGRPDFAEGVQSFVDDRSPHFRRIGEPD